ncbi:SAM-dependent methyltransferase [Streptomyces sp. DT195]|uniref:SAM-dependent methyltransferase n=1 Tax=Streptomyces sp. DT195 TaxID=3393419 RepID=UPI003CFAEDCA
MDTVRSDGSPFHFSHHPSVARVHDALDGGSDNYFVDRDLCEKLRALAYWLPDTVRINRSHGPRILAHVTETLGIAQVIDLGCGLPHDDNTRLLEAVRRIVYVDNDPMVEAHARMALAERSGTASLLADLTDMSSLLAVPVIARLDREQPIAVLLHNVLPYLGDDDARTVLETMRKWLPAGSVLSLTHATVDFDPTTLRQLLQVYAAATITYRPRTAEQIQSLLDGWTLLGDGLVTTAEWRSPSTYPRLDHSHAHSAVAVPETQPSPTPTVPQAPCAPKATPRAAGFFRWKWRPRH